MADSWMIVQQDGRRKSVPVQSMTRDGVLAAVRRQRRAGQDVVAAYLGGPRAIALCPQVYPIRSRA